MSNIKATAVLNMKETPAKIYIKGTVLTEHDDDKVIIIVAEFQGINPSILLCDLDITTGSLPIKPSPKSFHCEYDDDHAKDIKNVTIRQKGEKEYTIPCTVSN